MKRTMMLFGALLAAAALHAQGIRFSNELSWAEVKAKAAKEKKFIFVDCYATWCGPCRTMEKDVYPQQKVGDYFNERFISVKVQDDQTSKDDEHIRSWYADARAILSEYKVAAFPTFLFFSPDGQIIHRSAGGGSPDDLIALAKAAQDPSKQFYRRIAAFKSGDTAGLDLKELAQSAAFAGEDTVTREIAAAYYQRLSDAERLTLDNITFMSNMGSRDEQWLKQLAGPLAQKIAVAKPVTKEMVHFLQEMAKDNALAEKITNEYIASLPDSILYSKPVIEFLSRTIRSTKAESFRLLYNNTARIDKIMGRKNFSQFTLDVLIAQDEVNPHIFPHMDKEGFNPPWEKMEAVIGKKYNARYAERIIVKTKAAWYGFKKDMAQFTHFKIKELDLTEGGSLDGAVINDCWGIFENSRHKQELQRAAYWVKRVMDNNPQAADPPALSIYANLLYKAGEKEEGLKWQEKALQKEMKVAPDAPNPIFAEMLGKMKRNEPTWPQ